jgi:hypothetical protein
MIIMTKTLLSIYHYHQQNKRHFFEDLLMPRDVSVNKDICRYHKCKKEKIARFTAEEIVDVTMMASQRES